MLVNFAEQNKGLSAGIKDYPKNVMNEYLLGKNFETNSFTLRACNASISTELLLGEGRADYTVPEVAEEPKAYLVYRILYLRM